ncbi:MAG TPA: FtsX-like permease family protein, partial [Cyclobacteriaceae bacterium]|nr:FtsX-like permease family protein [Cyclobacteriaceae bacterium]
LAIGGVLLLTPWFSDITGRTLGYGLFSQPIFWTVLIIVIGLGAVLAGFYPAIILSSYRPAEVLKGNFRNSGQGAWLRKTMVIVQFSASLTLIVGTLTVYSQISYMRKEDLGVDVEQTLVVNSPLINDSTQVMKYQAFKNAILENSEVATVTAASAVPGNQPDWNAGGIRRLSQRPDESNQYRVIEMDNSYIPSFGLKIVAGRNFSDALPGERKNVMLNEAGARLMGFSKPEDAIDDRIIFWGDTLKIVGVVKNYHQESLKKAFEPLIFRYFEAPNGYYSIRFNTGDVNSSISRFEATWKKVFPGNPFHYFFLDSHYEQQYQADKQFGEVFGLFSTLAIFIACLGLLGLSSLSALQRSKEVGIRKVLGASVPGILVLMSKEFLSLVAVAFVVSVPLAAWIMNAWLQDFAYRIPLSWWLFVLPGVMVTVIALLTISVQTMKAAMANPVKSLRSE